MVWAAEYQRRCQNERYRKCNGNDNQPTRRFIQPHGYADRPHNQTELTVIGQAKRSKHRCPGTQLEAREDAEIQGCFERYGQRQQKRYHEAPRTSVSRRCRYLKKIPQETDL